MKVGQLVVLVDEVDGLEAGREGCIMGVRDDKPWRTKTRWSDRSYGLGNLR